VQAHVLVIDDALECRPFREGVIGENRRTVRAYRPPRGGNTRSLDCTKKSSAHVVGSHRQLGIFGQSRVPRNSDCSASGFSDLPERQR
jgi:hypothetical protein